MRKQTYQIRSNLTVTLNGVVLPKLPSASDINIGEIALNYKDGYETISIKNDNNEIVTFATLELLINYMEGYYGNAKIFKGSCATAAATTAKVVTCPLFKSTDLVKGTLIFVTFDLTNSGAVGSLTMNVNSTGAKSIKKLINNTAIASSNLSHAGELKANQTYLFEYDGTYWVCTTLDYNSTYSAMTQAEASAGTATTARTISAKVLHDTIEESIPIKSIAVNDIALTPDTNKVVNIDLTDYDKVPLIIEVNDTDTTVPSGTYASITAALAAGRDVVLKMAMTESDGEIYLLSLSIDYSQADTNYIFDTISYNYSYEASIDVTDHFVLTYTELAELNHVHGNITSGGSLQTSDISIANGDKLVVTDSSDSNKIARASLLFDGSTTTKALTPKGTWEPFLKTAPVTSVNGQTGDVEVVVPQSLLLKGITPRGHTLADAADSYYANELNNGEAGAWFISYSNGDILVKSNDTSKDQNGRVCLSSSWKSRLNYGGMTWANVGDILLVYKQSSLIVVYKVMSINEAGETRIGLMSPNDKIQVNKISNIEGNVNNLLGKIDKRLPYSTDSTNIGNAGNGAYTNVTAGRTNWLDTSTAGAAIKLGNLQIAIDNSGRLYSRNQTNNIWNVTNQLKTITETDLNNVFEPSVIGYATVTNGPSETGNYTVYTFTSSDYDGNGFRSILQIAINRNSGNQYMRTCFKKVDGSGTDFTSTDWKLVSPSVTSVNGQTGEVTITETQLSKGTTTGTGNAVTDINVSNHQITLVKGATYATQSDIDTSIANLVDSAPETLDTLNELAAALGDDPNFATTVANQIGQKYTKPNTGIPASDLAAGVIPAAPGTLNTNNTTAQTVSSSEALSGAIKLHKVSKTGSYSDLIKPSTGIPKTDLASAVQTSLGKADTALQSFTETDPTVPSHVKSITQQDITNWNNKLSSAPVTSVNGQTGAVVISDATTTTNGLMSSNDKIKLNELKNSVKVFNVTASSFEESNVAIDWGDIKFSTITNAIENYDVVKIIVNLPPADGFSQIISLYHNETVSVPELNAFGYCFTSIDAVFGLITTALVLAKDTENEESDNITVQLLKCNISNKQDAISDLNNIRNNAEEGSQAWNALANYQELLVSGKNIKTINDESILQKGNISIYWDRDEKIRDKYENQYLTFEIVEPGTIEWQFNGGSKYASYKKQISYNINDQGWNTTDATNDLFTIGTFEVGDIIQFKGNASNYGEGANLAYNYFSGTASFNIYGNILSLRYNTNELSSHRNSTIIVRNLFEHTNVINAKNLILPYVTISACYCELFFDCKKLISAPELPAPIISGISCYKGMFSNCTNLEIGPKILARSIQTGVDNCNYSLSSMFSGCTKLKLIYCLLESVDVNNTTTFYDFTKNVASTGTFCADINAEWPTGTNGIPVGWQVCTPREFLENVLTKVNNIENNAVTSVNGMTGAVTIENQLSNDYSPSTLINEDLVLESGDTYEEAFGKLEKSINDNEQITAAALTDLDSRINTLHLPQSLDDIPDGSTRKLSDYATTTLLATKQDALVSGTNIKTINNESLLGSGNITIQGGSGGDTNVIETVKVNGTALTPDANKAVNITSVPVGIVTQDATHRFVSDTEKTTWNGKQNALLHYTENNGVNISTYISEGDIDIASYDDNGGWAVGEVILNTSGVTLKSKETATGNNDEIEHTVTLNFDGFKYDNKQIATTDQIPSAVTESTVSGWGFTKNAGTITGITMNGASKGTSGVVDLGTVITSETALSKGTTTGNGNAVTDISVNGHQITLTKGTTFLTSHQGIKTLKTDNTTAQSTSSSEAIAGSGTINLHKVAKTGTYSDLIGKPTIPTVNNATLTIQKNGTTVNTFTANASSNVTANIQVNELPTVSSSDNGKVLMVVNGAWALVNPTSIYSGTSEPDSNTGNNGDLYLQTS